MAQIEAAANQVGPQVPPQHVLVEVPRAVLTKYRDYSWAALLEAAERGDDGLSVTDSKKFGVSYFREGDKGGLLEGKPSLFCQGWVSGN